MLETRIHLVFFSLLKLYRVIFFYCCKIQYVQSQCLNTYRCKSEYVIKSQARSVHYPVPLWRAIIILFSYLVGIWNHLALILMAVYWMGKIRLSTAGSSCFMVLLVRTIEMEITIYYGSTFPLLLVDIAIISVRFIVQWKCSRL